MLTTSRSVLASSFVKAPRMLTTSDADGVVGSEGVVVGEGAANFEYNLRKASNARA